MLGVERFLNDAAAKNLVVHGPITSGGMSWVVVDGFEVMVGKYAGQIVQIAVPVPQDFPMTPPSGLYVSPCIMPVSEMGARNVHDRSNETVSLPGSWQYWSRPVPSGTWRTECPIKRLIAHWNAVFANVN